MLATRVDRQSAYEILSAPRQVAAAIEREIREGLLKPGDRLPSEPELADLFGVSRPTVRAGLQELRAARIVEVQRGRNGGYRVAPLSPEMLEMSVTNVISLSLVVETLRPDQFFEVRYALELLSAGAAARQRDGAAVQQLEEIAADIEKAGSEPRRAFQLDLQFHRVLAAATQNPLLLSFERAMIAVLHQLLGDGASIAQAAALGNVPDVIDAVLAGDAEASREAMRRHLAHSAAHFGLRTDGLVDNPDPPALARADRATVRSRSRPRAGIRRSDSRPL